MAGMRRKSVFGSLALAVLAVAAVLAFFGAAAPAALAASGPAGTGAISGRVFFDANGDGLIGPDVVEQGIPAVTLQLLGVTPAITTATDASGVYTFSGLAAGSYTVAELLPAGYVTTTATSKPVSVGTGLVGGVNFGIAYPIFLSGAVCQDLNADGACGLATVEPRIAGATVQVFDDANRNELIDMGEATLATTLTDTRGQYLVSNLRPGSRIVLIRLPGGAEGNTVPLSLTSSEAGAATFLQNFAVGQSAIAGTVFNDLNGNEFIDAGEAPRKGAVVQLLAAAGGQALSPISVIATATTGLDGKYVFPKLLVAAYQVQVVPSSVPAGWLLSPDRSALIPALQANVTTTLNIGFFDPKSAPPMSLADWKREFRQSGQWAYTATEQQNYITAAQATSRVFSEMVNLRDALLWGGAAGMSTDKWRALKEHAALWMNLASLRLRPETRVKLGTLSTATTVRQARDEIEALLLYGDPVFVKAIGRESGTRDMDVSQDLLGQAMAPRGDVVAQGADFGRALAIAQALNSGKGVGAGLTGTSAVVDAIYRGAQVSNKLKPGGDVVTVGTDGPLTLRKWSPGSYNASTNTLMAQARIRVKSFNEGGVLDVVQVFPDGRRVTLGTAQSVVQNKDVNATFYFNLSRVTTVAELVNTTLVLTARDVNSGKAAMVKVDSAEIVFGY